MSIEKKYKQFRKDLKKGKYKTAIRTGGACVATACVVILGVYFFQGKRAEDDIDTLRDMKAAAQTQADSGSVSRGDGVLIADEYQELYLQNTDFLGWLTIDGTKIDYPVMWTPNDTEFYSDHGFDKEESANGLLFMDGSSNINEYGGNVIIYGHNMKNGSMFADLLNYKKQSYWENHKTIQFDTLYETRIYEITAVASGNDLSVFPYGFTGASQEEAETAIASMKEHALYDTGVDMKFGNDFLTLSTCDYSDTDGRVVVMAKRVE
ncbi:MAG: class B sortase [Clostridiales bacterium]|nr:class B sortase [Clostridiales bacterium]